jgi:outer membrane murein-binding lipoprotein Lpp
MIRKTLIAASLIAIGSGLAGTAFSQGGKPVTVPTDRPIEMNPALMFDARIDKLEKDVGTLKTRVQMLCDAVGKQASQLKAMQSSGNNESVVMQPPQGIKGSCL